MLTSTVVARHQQPAPTIVMKETTNRRNQACSVRTRGIEGVTYVMRDVMVIMGNHLSLLRAAPEVMLLVAACAPC